VVHPCQHLGEGVLPVESGGLAETVHGPSGAILHRMVVQGTQNAQPRTRGTGSSRHEGWIGPAGGALKASAAGLPLLLGRDEKVPPG
jgi:hypothetical protein